jgi:hypothetical protein
MTIHNKAKANGLSSLLTVMSLLGASLGVAIASPDEGRGSDKSVTDKTLATRLAQTDTQLSKPKYQMNQLKTKSNQYKPDPRPKYLRPGTANTLNPQPLPPEPPPPRRY